MVRLVLEISGNHGGDLAQCHRLIGEAKRLKPAAIKFQCFTPDTLAIKRQDNPEIAVAIGLSSHTTEERRLYLVHLYNQTHTPKAWWPKLLDELNGYPWASSVFSLEDLVFCEGYACPSYKIASFELRDLDLIRGCAATRKPLTMSVNAAATTEDVHAAIEAATGAERITLLHASSYAHRKVMTTADLEHEKNRYAWLCTQAPPHIEVGLSDHSPPTEYSLLNFAIDKDCDMVERHIRLAELKTADSAFSSTSRQLAQYMQRMNARAVARNRLEIAAR